MLTANLTQQFKKLSVVHLKTQLIFNIHPYKI